MHSSDQWSYEEDDQNITLKDTTTKNWEITGRRARAPAFNYSGERPIRGELSWAEPIGEFRTKLGTQAPIASTKTL